MSRSFWLFFPFFKKKFTLLWLLNPVSTLFTIYLILLLLLSLLHFLILSSASLPLTYPFLRPNPAALNLPHMSHFCSTFPLYSFFSPLHHSLTLISLSLPLPPPYKSTIPWAPEFPYTCHFPINSPLYSSSFLLHMPLPLSEQVFICPSHPQYHHRLTQAT